MLILALNSNHLLGKSTPVGKEDKTADTKRFKNDICYKMRNVLAIRSRVLNTSLNIYFSCILLNSYTSLTRFIIESCVYTRMVCGLVETQPRRWCNG